MFHCTLSVTLHIDSVALYPDSVTQHIDSVALYPDSVTLHLDNVALYPDIVTPVSYTHLTLPTMAVV